jgi:hypothetical protein
MEGPRLGALGDVKVTLLGHASVLVETGAMRILMDPVLRDPFESGMVVSCPKRKIHLERLPPIDVVVVSHRHPDHFDLSSLDLLPRACQVVCPEDPLIAHALRALGFEHVTPMTPGVPMPAPHAELYPTRSESQAVRECGVLVRDADGVFWNQVDTELADETIAEVRRRFGAVDLLFAMYASQNFEFFDSLASEFPVQSHRRNLETALSIRPGLLAPASAGFRFAAEHAWLNRFLFPVSRERFADDLRQLDPELRVALLDPGDAVQVGTGDAKIERGASPFATTLERDTEAIRFDPTAPIPPLRDPNPEGRRSEAMSETVRCFLAQQLLPHCARAVANPGSLAARYRGEGVVYELEVVFPDTARVWTLDFRAEPLALREGRDALANVAHRIAASALVGWIERRLSWFSVRACSRRFSSLTNVVRMSRGVDVRPLALPDLLIHFLVYEAADSGDAAKRRIDREIAALRRSAGAP